MADSDLQGAGGGGGGAGAGAKNCLYLALWTSAYTAPPLDPPLLLRVYPTYSAGWDIFPRGGVQHERDRDAFREI